MLPTCRTKKHGSCKQTRLKQHVRLHDTTDGQGRYGPVEHAGQSMTQQACGFIGRMTQR